MGKGDSPHNGLYGEGMPERGTSFKLQEYEGCGFNKWKYMKGYEDLFFPYIK